MKFIRILLLVLIIIGIGLLVTKDSWVPKVVDILIARDHTPLPFVLERPVASSTVSVGGVDKLQTRSFEGVGVSVTYPSAWFATTTDYFFDGKVSLRSVSLSNSKDFGASNELSWHTEVSFSVRRLKNQNPLELSLGAYFDGASRSMESVAQKKKLIVDGRDAIQIEASEIGGPYIITYFVDKKDIVEVTYSLIEPTFIPTYEAVLKSIHFLSETPLPYGEVSLKVGETAKFADLSLTLVRVFDDSRCPTGVTCIWAGTVKSELQVVSGMGKSTTTVELGKSVTTEAEEIALLSATPYPKEGTAIPGSEYKLTFRVEKRR